MMSDEPEVESPRKMSDVSSLRGSTLRGAELKRKAPRAVRRATSPERKHPFMENDEFSDVRIMVKDKIIYTNKCLLAFHSPVLMDYFKGDVNASNGAGKTFKAGKSSTPSQTGKDLDWSDKNFDLVYNLLAFIDPRVDFTMTDEDAFRLLPIAEEYQMKQLIRTSEDTLTRTFYKMRKNHRQGCLPVDTTMQYLKIGDRFKYADLTNMCTEECIANESPNIVRAITECPDLSEPIKVSTLRGKLDKVSFALAKERRAKVEREMTKDTTGKKWRK